MNSEAGDRPGQSKARVRMGGLIAGLAALFLTVWMAPPGGMAPAAWHCAGLAGLMALWWASEAIPIAVTSLLPVVLVPALGLGSLAKATAPYADPVIFLFLGGFLLGLAMQLWNLHRRIALLALWLIGPRPRQQIGGFMLVTGFLSMWVSNTATSMMMLPIGLSVIGSLDVADRVERDRFRTALLLAIAYSASIGGIATLIGTPPNAMLAAYLSGTQGIHIGFAQWMLVGLPVTVVMMALAWWWLTRRGFRFEDRSGGRGAIRAMLTSMGPLNAGEKRLMAVFFITACSWILRPWLQNFVPWLSDTAIAMVAAISLFVIPAAGSEKRLLIWSVSRDVPWGVLLLFGGGLSLAEAIQSSGLGLWIAGELGFLKYLPLVLVIAGVVGVIIFLTEITSNTATAATFLPLVGALAESMGTSPLFLVVPAAIAASCAFMMPVATPPNAIVFSAGDIAVHQMMRAGLVLNLFGILVVTALSYGAIVLWFQGGWR